MNTIKRFEIVGYRRGAGGLNGQSGMRGRKPRVENELSNEPDTLDIPEQNELKEDNEKHELTPEKVEVNDIDDKKLQKENVDVIEIKQDEGKTKPANNEDKVTPANS